MLRSSDLILDDCVFESGSAYVRNPPPILDHKVAMELIKQVLVVSMFSMLLLTKMSNTEKLYVSSTHAMYTEYRGWFPPQLRFNCRLVLLD